MKKLFSETFGIIKENISVNVLTIAVLLYFCVMTALKGHYLLMLLFPAAFVCYIAGAFIGGIRKYIPIVLSIMAILVFLAAGVMVIAGKNIPLGFVVFGVAIIFYSITGYDSTHGFKCLPYCFAMFGAECVFCLNGDTRGVIVLVGALLLSVMFCSATYTAMSRYVFTLFLSLVILKLTGIWHIIRGTRPSGLIDEFIDSPVLYVALVALGIISMLMRERHPRYKSDRDKKNVPVLKQWQAVIGFSMIMLVFWGLSYIETIYNMELTGLSADMRMNLIYVASITALGDSTMSLIMRGYGFFPLMFFTVMMISFVYKAYVNFRATHQLEDKLFMLMMAGFFVSFAYFDLCVPVVLICSLLAGCVVNGEYKIRQK